MYNKFPFNFLALPSKLSSYKNSKISILPVGYDSTTSYRSGTREAPLNIINASRFMETYDPELQKDFTSLGITTLSPLTCEMSGPKNMIEEVEKAALKLLEDEKFIVMLGGEHTLTVGMVRAFLQKFSNFGVLQIDAHLDLRDSYEGTKYNHACAMRRIVDDCPIAQVGFEAFPKKKRSFSKKETCTPTTFGTFVKIQIGGKKSISLRMYTSP